MHLNKEPWNRLLWSKTEGMMPRRGGIALALMLYMVGADLSAKTSEESLLNSYRKAVDDPDAQIEHLRYANVKPPKLL
ncbi:MAG: hypothetical protein FJ319_08750 [SAR202 cluster bacterium]|nr:hypothetical protein [SAR202 cluster bacterium]